MKVEVHAHLRVLGELRSVLMPFQRMDFADAAHRPPPQETVARREETRPCLPPAGGFLPFGAQPPDLFIVQDEFRHQPVKNAVFLPVDILATKKALSFDWIVLELPRFTVSVLESRPVYFRSNHLFSMRVLCFGDPEYEDIHTTPCQVVFWPTVVFGRNREGQRTRTRQLTPRKPEPRHTPFVHARLQGSRKVDLLPDGPFESIGPRDT